MAAHLATDPTFDYEPLEPGQIRILHLYPSNESSNELRGHLTVASIEDARPFYSALSYEWSDPTPADYICLTNARPNFGNVRHISENVDENFAQDDDFLQAYYECHGHSITHSTARRHAIAANLAAALYSRRGIDQSIPFWVDAICINQIDLAERAQQVSIMRQIYRKANVVDIWINEPSIDEDEEAITALTICAEHNPLVEHLGQDPDFWKPVIPLFRNPYWSRVWIQQEVVNAQYISLYCGKIWINHWSLINFQETIAGFLDANKYANDAHSLEWFLLACSILPPHLAPATQISSFLEGGIDRGLLSLLYGCRELNVTNERDRVYGLMNIAEDYEEGGLEVDYRKLPGEVMLDAITYHVKRNRTLLFLCHRHLDYETSARLIHSDIHVPTWFPLEYFGQRKQTGSRISLLLNSISDSKCAPGSVSADRRRLSARGFMVCEVELCSPLGHPSTIENFWRTFMGVCVLDRIESGNYRLSEEWYAALSCGFSGDPPSYKDTNSGLSTLHGLSQDERWADQPLGFFGEKLPEIIHDHERAALRAMLRCMDGKMIILTKDSDWVGLAPSCAVEEGDEIWVLLGCPLPLILRPVEGAYWHVSPVAIPQLKDHNAIMELSSDIHTGAVIGDWTVTGIEIL